MHILPSMSEVELLPLFFVAIFLFWFHVSYMNKYMEREFQSLKEARRSINSSVKEDKRSYCKPFVLVFTLSNALSTFSILFFRVC